MVRIAAALLGAVLLGSCARGARGPARADLSAGYVARAAEDGDADVNGGGAFDPAQTALERELSEDLGDADDRTPGARAAAHAVRRSRARFAIEGGDEKGVAGDNEYVSSDGERLRLRVRRKRSENAEAIAGYGAVCLPGGSLTLHAGCFVPDLDGGLTAGGGRSPYVFSSGFPLEEPREIAPATSFYGLAIAGGAVVMRFGRIRAAAFAGRERVVREGRSVPTRRGWAGGRVNVRCGFADAAAWALAPRGDPAPALVGAGVRSTARAGRFRLEGVWRRGAPPGALAAAAIHLPSARAGAIAYALPAGVGGPFARVCSNDLSAAAAHSGGAAAVEGRMPLRLRARAAVEWRERSEADEDRARVRLRAQVEKRWRGGELSVEWSITDERETPTEPFPASGGAERETARSLGATARFPLPRGVEHRAAARILAQRPGAEGILYSYSARLERLSRRFRATIFHALYVASPGAPSCFAYEPSLAGAYPWRYLVRGRSRGGAVIIIKFNRIDLSCKAVWEDGNGFEWSAHAGCGF